MTGFVPTASPRFAARIAEPRAVWAHILAGAVLPPENCRSGIDINADPTSAMVGMTGFEPATPSSRTTCATKLRHIPIVLGQAQRTAHSTPMNLNRASISLQEKLAEKWAVNLRSGASECRHRGGCPRCRDRRFCPGSQTVCHRRCPLVQNPPSQ